MSLIDYDSTFSIFAIASVYMSLLAFVIVFFRFYGRIFCAETSHFVDEPIIGYFRLRYVEFLFCVLGQGVVLKGVC